MEEMVQPWLPLCIALLSVGCAMSYGGCWYNNQYVQLGPFQPEPCLSCFCFDTGSYDCFIIQCPKCLFYYYKPGDCCASCEPPPPPAQAPSRKTTHWEPEEPNEGGI